MVVFVFVHTSGTPGFVVSATDLAAIDAQLQACVPYLDPSLAPTSAAPVIGVHTPDALFACLAAGRRNDAPRAFGMVISGDQVVVHPPPALVAQLVQTFPLWMSLAAMVTPPLPGSRPGHDYAVALAALSTAAAPNVPFRLVAVIPPHGDLQWATELPIMVTPWFPHAHRFPLRPAYRVAYLTSVLGAAARPPPTFATLLTCCTQMLTTPAPLSDRERRDLTGSLLVQCPPPAHNAAR